MMAALILLLAAPLLAVTFAFVVETWLGIAPPGRQDVPQLIDASRVAVLIPAHDEALDIAETLARLRAVAPAGMRIVVVADNCTDETAAIARTAGVEVIERHDPTRRGKGFALDFGRSHLAATPPLCVVVVDADTVPAPGALAAVAARALASDRPVQGAYTLEPGDQARGVARLSSAAFFVKNVVRELGAARLGAPAILTGSGMAFPWRVFAALPLATGHVTEDLMLGVRASLAGDAPRFAVDARFAGTASSERGTMTQRRRWESGFLEVARAEAGTLVRRGIAERRPSLAWLGLHLVTPPLVLLLVADAAALVVLGALALLGIEAVRPALGLLLALTALAALGVPLALAGHRRLDLLRDWSGIPRYLLWKAMLSIGTLVRREKSWIRTDRR